MARQPDLDVVRLARGKPHLAAAQQHHPVRQIETLEHLLGASRHAIELFIGLLGEADADQLDLGELMLAHHAAGVLAGGAGLGAKARRERGDADRQPRLVDDLARGQVGQRHLGRGNEVIVVCGAEQVIGELGQVAGAERRRLAHEKRRVDLGVAELAGVHIEHEGGERPLHARQRAREHDEARPRHARRALEVHAPERLADLEMLLHREVEASRLARAAQLEVGALVHALRHRLLGRVGLAGQQRIEPGRGGALVVFERANIVLDLGDLGHEAGAVLAPALRLADGPRGLVAPLQQRLEACLQFPPLIVEVKDLSGLCLETALL